LFIYSTAPAVTNSPIGLYIWSKDNDKRAGFYEEHAEQAGLLRILFRKTFQRRVLDTVEASELDWILTSHPDMVINKDKLESAMSDHDMIIWGLIQRVVGQN
jgi:hypothetical protein